MMATMEAAILSIFSEKPIFFKESLWTAMSLFGHFQSGRNGYRNGRKGVLNMKTLIDILVVSLFSIAAIQGSRYGLEKTATFIQMLALEKAATGLGSLESATQKMTGGKLDF